jgi:type IV pilus biogenesis protein CpaD/CtpE
MSRSFLRLAAAVVAVSSLSACAQVPPDYSPHYVRVPVYSTVKPNRIVGYQLVPEACLTPDPTDNQLGARLPPGCANNANLLAMVERKRDLVEGRKLGPAPALPSARAAKKYIYGTDVTPTGTGAGTGAAATGPTGSGSISSEAAGSRGTSAPSGSH